MDTIIQDEDIKVFYVTARSFPDGIAEALQEIHKRAAPADGRRYFGVSRPENGVITYRGAAEEIQAGEAEESGCDTLVLRRGRYISITVSDYARDITAIGKAFEELLQQPGLDPQGYCVEWYQNDKDVQCMIRLEH